MRTIKLIITLLLSIRAYGRVGLADWSATTPGGNEINNFIDYSLYLKNGTQLDYVSEWYFYKNHVIGRLQKEGDTSDISGYFVVNEATYKIDLFKTKAEWASFLEQEHLQPRVWTRWYQNNWVTFNDWTIMLLLASFYISVPLAILFLVMLYRAIRKEKFSFRKPNTLIVTAVTLLVFVSWLLGQYPQSI